MLLSSIYCYVEESSYTLLPDIYIYIYIYIFFFFFPLLLWRLLESFFIPSVLKFHEGVLVQVGWGVGIRRLQVLNAVLCTHPLESAFCRPIFLGDLLIDWYFLPYTVVSFL